MNPLKLKYSSTLKKPQANDLKKINILSPSANLITKKIGGWRGYFIEVDGVEKQITKHKYFTHPSSVKKLLSISKSGYASDNDKSLLNYYKKLSSSSVKYKVAGVNTKINLDPKFEEQPKSDPHTSPVQMTIGKTPETDTQEKTSPEQNNIASPETTDQKISEPESDTSSTAPESSSNTKED